MTTELPSNPDGFGAFYRQYARSWIHAVATAGLTAFGTLTFINRWFAVLAISAYLVPPIALYARSRRVGGDEKSDGERTGTDRERSSPEGEKPERTEADSGDSSPSVPAGDSESSDGIGDSADSGDRSTPGSVTEEAPTAGGEPDDDPGTGEDVSGSANGEDGPKSEPGSQAKPTGWEIADTPTETTLRDAAVAGGVAYAAGDGGVVIEGGEGWSVLLEDGPSAAGNDLHGIDGTDDGAAVWVAGDGGAIGRIDAGTGRHTDLSAPDGRTDNLAGIAVAGPAGGETVLAIDGSGGVLRGRYDGTEARWEGPVTPGGGSSLSGVTLEGETGYCCDTNDGVFETEDGGGSFEAIGPVGASGTLVDVAIGPEGPLAGSDEGVVHRREGSNWTPERIADSLVGLDCHGTRTVVCTESDVLEREDPGSDWDRADPIGAEGLRAVAVGPDRGVAVGENGTVVERRG